MRVVAVSSDMVTPYGRGTDACWNNIFSCRTAISPLKRFDTSAFQSCCAGTVEGLKYHEGDSLVMQMLTDLFVNSGDIPVDSDLLVATTKGEIDLLEAALLQGRKQISENSQAAFLEKVRRLARVNSAGTIISAACSSAAVAAARAAAMIRSGRSDCVLVVACDSVTEFVFSGFSSLMALEKIAAMPFDKNRSGLSLGEAAAFVLLMSEHRARKENREVLGEVLGWGVADDANHMTGPSRLSEGLVLAIGKALSSARLCEGDVGFISAHGTGTVYNDSMEIRAFNAVFREKKPAYSIKGGIGHTMGAAGLVELIIAMKALREGKVPPTVNLREADSGAEGWVSAVSCPLQGNSVALMTNAGFGGINSALVLA